jgi:hypothetical protein
MARVKLTVPPLPVTPNSLVEAPALRAVLRWRVVALTTSREAPVATVRAEVVGVPGLSVQAGLVLPKVRELRVRLPSRVMMGPVEAVLKTARSVATVPGTPVVVQLVELPQEPSVAEVQL